MKRKILLLMFFVFALIVKSNASGEVLSVILTSGTGQPYHVYDETQILKQVPCTQMLFEVEFTPPVGGTPKNWQWYANGTLVLTSTSSSQASIAVSSLETVVTCTVTYQVGQGQQATFTSSTSNQFTVRSLLFSVTLSQQNEAVYGCSTPVTFTTSTFNQQGFYQPDNYYTVTWAAPVNWSISSVSSDGHTISFIPDPISSGNVTATVHLLGCSVQQSFSNPVVRTSPKTSFLASSYFVCPGMTNQTYQIDPACGAVSYTYSLSQGSGCFFTANGGQSYTTSVPSVNVSFPQSSFSETISAVVNYPGGSVSLPSSTNLVYGIPSAPTNLRLNNITCPEYTYMCDYVSNYNYNWSYYSLSTHVQTNLNITSGVAKIVFPANGSYNIGVSRTNSCGTSPVSFISTNVTCSVGGGGHRLAVIQPNKLSSNDSGLALIESDRVVYPNPASSYVYVNLNKRNQLAGSNMCKLLSYDGSLIRTIVIKDQQQTLKISLEGLRNGTYLLQFTGKNGVMTRKLVKH